MDNVSFPSRLFIIYGLNTEKTGSWPARNNKHSCKLSYTSIQTETRSLGSAGLGISYLSVADEFKTMHRKDCLYFLPSSLYPIIPVLL